MSRDLKEVSVCHSCSYLGEEDALLSEQECKSPERGMSFSIFKVQQEGEYN